MSLATFIQQNLERILVEWESFARTLLPAAGTMSTLALRDHARQILTAIADDMLTRQTRSEQKEKSLGLAPAEPTDSAATLHGGLREDVGFNLIQLVAEFRALRASVLRMWTDQEQPGREGIEEMTRFNEAIDQAIAESVASYSAELGRSRDTFIGILGHDLRSPLSAITMSAHNVASGQLEPQQQARAVEMIQRSALTMKVMIRDLLDYAGSRLGKGIPMHPEKGNLLETCNVALNELMAAHPQRTFELEQSGDLEGEYDHVRIGEVLSNLLNNAVIHGDAMQPVRMAALGEPGWLRVDVKNAGPAIGADALRLIFDPLTAIDKPARSGSSGLGLGLYIAREIAQAHGGAIEASSSSGETVFTLRLPRAVAA